MNQREQLAKENDMSIDFVNWFFDNKKEGCGNVWFMMMAAMWEGWKPQSEQVRQLTEQRDAVVAESVELKSKGRELLNEACKVYEAFNASVDPASGDFIDGQTLHEFQFVLDTVSVNTSAILDSLRAEGVDMFASETEKLGWHESTTRFVRKFGRQLRESKGAQS